MGKHRSKLQIIADVLFVVGNNAKKTRIMRQANLSYKLLAQYLSFVIEAGLVRFKDANSYTLTSRGHEFLKEFEEYSRRYTQLKEQFDDINNQRIALEKRCFNMNKVGDDFKECVVGSKRSNKHNFIKNLNGNEPSPRPHRRPTPQLQEDIK